MGVADRSGEAADQGTRAARQEMMKHLIQTTSFQWNLPWIYLSIFFGDEDTGP